MEKFNCLAKQEFIIINRKRTEFDLETLEIGQTLAEKRLGQAAELIAEMDEAAQSSAAIAAASAAIANEDIAELRAAASGLGTDEVQAQIAEYLNVAADALESYIEK